jgi:plastocyanin
MSVRRASRRCWPVVLLFCAAHALAGTVTVEVRDATGAAVSDAVVVLDPAERAPAGAHESIQIDQVNQQFVPRVSVIRAGTAIAFPNSDRVRHQVYSFSPANTFALKLYAGSPKTLVPFDKPGIVTMGCNIHDSMVAFVLVVDTPYFGKSNSAGSVALKVPVGRYRLRVWHEHAARAHVAEAVTVGVDAQSLPVSLTVDPGSAVAPAWPE